MMKVSTYVSKYTDAEKAERKARLFQCNKDIARHASRKELSEAKSIFQLLMSDALVNSHTYSSVINAHIRCGDMQGASAVFDQLKKVN